MIGGRPGGPLRVAVLARAVFPLHGFGGLERHVYDLVRHLTCRGLRLTLITRPPSRRVPPEPLPPLAGENLAVLYVPYWTFPLAGRRWTTALDRSTAYPLFGLRAGRVAAGLVARGEIDLVHGLGAAVLGYARVRRRGSGPAAPLIFNPQGLEEFGASAPAQPRLKALAYRPLQAAVRACARAADRIIANDRALEPVVRRHLGVGPTKVRLVPNALDLDLVDRMTTSEDGPRVRREAGMAPEQLVLLSVGRLEHNKGFHHLAEALAHVGVQLPAASSWTWVLIGAGPYRPALERLIDRLGIGGRVRLLGRVPDRMLHAWYEWADVFVHPTLYEGSSIVTLEAMAHRRPVIATAAGGLPDKVRDGETGWLLPPGDPRALTRAVGEALADRGRLAALGAAGRRLLEREFSWEAVTDRLLSVYDELLAEQPTR
jgi:glycogen synthase